MWSFFRFSLHSFFENNVSDLWRRKNQNFTVAPQKQTFFHFLILWRTRSVTSSMFIRGRIAHFCEQKVFATGIVYHWKWFVAIERFFTIFDRFYVKLIPQKQYYIRFHNEICKYVVLWESLCERERANEIDVSEMKRKWFEAIEVWLWISMELSALRHLEAFQKQKNSVFKHGPAWVENY